MTHDNIFERVVLDELLKEMEIKEMEYWYDLNGHLVNKVK